ncbi:uncharacterized protein LOC123668451 [Melitaea cinxia]|uniref:uncharacterized protein LOC123668451 n=2 Tax=Melitaea cinxia TaxID=113334 RepID=UPI001E2748BF|nr:uncharacterized protein LOC123668451 [Melitaea cinxia]
MKFACCNLTTGVSECLSCSKCSNNYHIKCLYPSDKRKELPTDTKKHWICPECTVAQPRSARNDSTPVRVQSMCHLRNDVDNVNSRRGAASEVYDDCVLDLTDRSSLIDVIKSVMSTELASFKAEINVIMNPIKEEIKLIKKEFENFRESLEYINTKFEEMVKRTDSFQEEIKVLSKKCIEIGKLSSSIEKIESENNNREQWARKSNVEIYGIPEKKNENLISLLQTIVNKTDLQINMSTDIDFVTRVASKKSENKKTKPIIVRFLCRWKKDEFLSVVRKLKLRGTDIGFNDGNSSIFFNDHLTSTNKTLLQSVKKAASDKNYKYVWVKNCSIMARRSDTSPVLHFTSLKDLNKIA